MLDARQYRLSPRHRRLRDEHSTYDWIMEGLIKQAGLQLLTAEYSNDVYADYLAVRPS